MTITWTPDLATGNPTIDSEHKELIRIISNLMDACSSGKGRLEMVNTIKFLNDYTIKHFSHEEELQRRSQYPDLNNHLRYHAEFRKTVQEIEEKIEKEGASVALLAQINQNIGVWFTNHIRMQDKRVAEHLKNTGNV